MADANLNDKENYTRLCCILAEKGTEAFQKLFDSFYSSTLAKFLKKYEGLLFKLKLKVINEKQWDLLFPVSGNPDSKKFDISLLSILLRNICSLKSPATGWSTKQRDKYKDSEADIFRLQLYRNEIFAHAAKKEVTDDKFEDLWLKISQTLVDLRISTTEINQLRESPLGPKGDSYLKMLKDWKIQEEKMNEILDEMKGPIVKMQKTTVEIEHIEEINESINEIQIAPSSQRPPDENLLQKLSKFNFNGDIKKLLHLSLPGTRERLFMKIKNWFSTRRRKVLVLTGAPGVGKSVLAAKIIQKYEEGKKLAACHFCKRNNSNYSKPLNVIQSLASQICDSVKGFKEKLLEQLMGLNEVENLQDAFQVYLKKPLQDLPRTKLMLVVIDGLNECERDGKTDLLDLLAEEFPKLPAWLKVLVTSRPEINVKMKLSSLECIEIQPADSNKENIKEHLTSQLSERVDKEGISKLEKECRGSFPYSMSQEDNLRERENNITTEVKAENPLPKRLKAAYRMFFDCLKPKLEAKSRKFTIYHLLKIIAVAYQPIPLSLFTDGLELKPNLQEMKQIIENANETITSLLLVSDESVIVSHKSVVEWLLLHNHKYTVTLKEGETLLWKTMERRLNEAKENFATKKNVSSIRSLTQNTTMQYVLEHGFQHLFRASDYIDVSFEWLVDVFVLHLMMSQSHESCIEAWRHFLSDHSESNESTMREIRLKVSWNYEHFSNYEVRPIYVQDIFNEGPKELFSDEEKRNAKYILDNYLHFWCEKQGYLHVIPPNRVTACSFSPDGSHLVSCVEDGKICIWKVNYLKLIQMVSSKCKHAILCFWSEDKEILIYHHAEDDLVLSRYPVDQNSSIQDENVQTHRIATTNDTPLAFSAQALICKYSKDSSIKVHRFTKMNEPPIYIREFGCMNKFAITRDGSAILAAGKDDYQIWKISDTNSTEYNLRTEKIELEKDEHKDCDCIKEVLSCAISNNQRWGIISYYCSKNEEPFILVIDMDVKNPREEDDINLPYPTDEKLHFDLIEGNHVIVDDVAAAEDNGNGDDHYDDYDDGNDEEDDDDDSDDYRDIFHFVQSYKRITVYSNKCMGPLTHFNHNGDPEYYKESSICRSGNMIALPQKSGDICIVKLHLPKTTWKNFGSRIAEFQWEI